MAGLFWTMGIWAVVLGLRAAVWRRPVRLGHLQVATIALLLSSHIVQPEIVRAANATADPLSTESVARGALLAVALVLVLPDVLRIRLWGRYRALGALTVYGAVAALSTVYSLGPVQSAGKAFELLTAVGILWAIRGTSRAGPEIRRTVHLVFALEAALVLAALAGFFLLPGTFTELQGRAAFAFRETAIAPFLTGTALGLSSAMVTVYGAALALTAPDRRVQARWGALALAGAAMVVLASTRQGLLVIGLGLLILLVITYRHHVVLWSAAAVGAVLVWGRPVVERLARGQTGDVLAELSGRTPRWEQGIDVFLEQPLQGVGYTMGRLATGTGPLHSGYFEVAVGLGLLGLVPFLYAVYRVVRWSLRQLAARDDDAVYAIVALPLIVYTAVSTGFGAQVSSAFVVFAALAALSDLEPAVAPERPGHQVRRGAEPAGYR